MSLFAQRPLSQRPARQHFIDSALRRAFKGSFTPPATDGSLASPARQPLDAIGQTRPTLRQRLRHRRRQLTPNQQRHAAQGMRRQLLQHQLLRRVRRVALYLPADGELDPRALLSMLQRHRITPYLPIIRPSFRPGLWFAKLTPRTLLKRNRFNLLEPAQPYAMRRAAHCAAWALDLVLMPLVGFDPTGARLGMGGGFYDRTFASPAAGGRKQPRLLGLAHDIQEVTSLPIAPWDVPLEGIVTATRYISARPHDR